jgi:hypothetical protein
MSVLVGATRPVWGGDERTSGSQLAICYVLFGGYSWLSKRPQSYGVFELETILGSVAMIMRWLNNNLMEWMQIKTKAVGFSPQANYTDWATAADRII